MKFKKIRFAIARVFIGKRRSDKRYLNELSREYFVALLDFLAAKISTNIGKYETEWLGDALSSATPELLRDAVRLNDNLTETQKAEITNIIDETPSYKGDYLQ